MSVKLLSGWFAAALVCAATAAAQNPPAQPPQPASDQPAAAQASTITIAGCVQKESDVLKRAAAAGDVGMSDEFVLTKAMLNPPASPAGPPSEAKPEQPTGTSGAAGKVFRVTGDKEKELKSLVGQRVEITGSFKKASDAQRELGTAGTSGSTPAELTPANTPEVTITSIKPASGACSGEAK
jgi:hypothetical protein